MSNYTIRYEILINLFPRHNSFYSIEISKIYSFWIPWIKKISAYYPWWFFLWTSLPHLDTQNLSTSCAFLWRNISSLFLLRIGHRVTVSVSGWQLYLLLRQEKGQGYRYYWLFSLTKDLLSWNFLFTKEFPSQKNSQLSLKIEEHQYTYVRSKLQALIMIESRSRE